MTDPKDPAPATPEEAVMTSKGDKDGDTPKETVEKEAKQDEKDEDEEGLQRHYDVILYGTGLVESIVASALARAGKTVLHCDPSDYYGSYDAVWTLPYARDTTEGLAKHLVDEADNNSSRTAAPEPKEKDANTLAVSQQGNVGLMIHSVDRTMTLDDYTIVGAAGSLVWTPKYGPSRVAELKLIRDNQEVQLKLSLLNCPLPDRSLGEGSSEQHQVKKHAELCLGLPVSLLDLTPEQASKLSDVELQRAVDRYYKTIQQQQPSPDKQQQQHLFALSSWHQRVDDDILEQRGRSFALDVSPALLLAWGPAVQGLLQSSVADYVEFKSLEQVLYGSSSQNKNSTSNDFVLQPVPCSKNDVFSSTLLSPMEKRRLMKFLQLALDYGLLLDGNPQETNVDASSEEESAATPAGMNNAAGDDEAVTSWNERHLNQGRSLARPQNKAVSTEDMAVLQQCLSEETTAKWDFESYLQEKQRLSPSLLSLVRYALALEPVYQEDAGSLESGMQRLCRHMQALGRFGNTAFLVPLYGSGELPQAFCRSAAVYGATYLLRRSLSSIDVTTGSDDNKASVVSGVWLRPPEDEGNTAAGDAKADVMPSKRVSCEHVVVPEHALPLSFSTVKRRVLRRISILRGKPMVSGPEQQQRVGIVVPPSADNHGYAIHALVLDESVNVAPHLSVKEPRQGCSVLHLSTVVDVENNDSSAVDDSVLKSAMDTILAQRKNPNDDCQEIFHVSFSFPLVEKDTASPVLPLGLHVVNRPAPDLILDTAFEQAKDIFETICPGKEFLALAQEIDTMVKERFGDRVDEEDDEKRVLESAMDMIDSTSQREESTEDSS